MVCLYSRYRTRLCYSFASRYLHLPSPISDSSDRFSAPSCLHDFENIAKSLISSKWMCFFPVSAIFIVKVCFNIQKWVNIVKFTFLCLTSGTWFLCVLLGWRWSTKCLNSTQMVSMIFYHGNRTLKYYQKHLFTTFPQHAYTRTVLSYLVQYPVIKIIFLSPP